MKFALVLASVLALGATPAPRDELVVAEWISTGAHVERHVLQPLRAAIDYLRVDPQNQTATNAVRLLDQRLDKTRATMGSIRDSLTTFERGLVTEPSRQFCDQVVSALDQTTAQIDSAAVIVRDMKRDSTLINTRGQDLAKPFQAIRNISWNTEAQRAQVLVAAERIRARR